MLQLRGAPALSSFRHDKLLADLQAQVPEISGLYAEYLHFAEVAEPLTAQELRVLETILQYGPKANVEEPAGQLLLVVPRPGTISPWSSKATDIAHNCGLAKVQRLERGIAYYIAGELSGEQRKAAAGLLHDRMVEADRKSVV